MMPRGSGGQGRSTLQPARLATKACAREWMSCARSALAAFKEPRDRWRPLLSKPTMRRRARLATVEREQKDERTSRKSTKAKGAHYEPNPDERSLTRGRRFTEDTSSGPSVRSRPPHHAGFAA